MISLPVVLTYKDISVFPDHEDCNLYYCLRTTPQVRINDAGEPVFRSIFWSSDKANDEKTFSGVRGGRMTFDVNLSVSADEEKRIAELLRASGIQQKRYNEIIAREKKRENLLSAITSRPEQDDDDEKSGHESSLSGFLENEQSAARTRIAKVDKITFGTVTYTSGSFELNDGNGGSLVEWHNGTRKPAMFGDNNAAVAVQFTPEGAAVACRAIQQRAQTVSVYFDMKVRMAMPALNVRIYAGSVEASSITRHLDYGCRKGKVYQDKQRNLTELLTDLGVINIEIDNLGLDEKTAHSIYDSMMSIMQKKVEEIVNSKIIPLTPEERKDQVNMILEQELKSFTEINFTETSNFDFNFAPQASLQEFFDNVTDEQLNKMVTLIDMSEKVFEWKRNMICADAPWNEKPFVNKIKVDCEYLSLPEGHSERIRSFVFDENKQTEEWDFTTSKIIKDDNTIRYTPHVYLKGHTYDDDEGITLPTQTTTGNYVIVSIGKIGIIDVTLKANPNVLNLPSDLKVSSIMCDFWYNDAKGKRIMGPEQIILRDLEGEVKFEKDLGIILDQPLHYQVTYNFKNIDPIKLPEKKFYLGDDGVKTIYSDFPFKNRKTIQVELPTDPDDSVKEINGDIFYGKYTFPVQLSKEDEWEPKKVNLCTLDEVIKNYTYQFNLKYNNSEFEMLKSEIMKGNTESSSLVVPIKKIEVAGIDLMSLGTKYYRAQVTISLPEGFGRPIEFSLSKKDSELESKKFYVFCPEDKKLELNWTMSLWDMEGNELPAVNGKTDKLFFILTPPKNKE